MALVSLAGAIAPRALDSNGDAVSGALLYVFTAGTTTAVTTYTDDSGTTANAHPVVADSSGAFSPIFVSQDVLKIDIRTPAGASLPGYPVDDVSFVAIGTYDTQAALEAATVAGSIYALDTLGYAAVGDGGGGQWVRVDSEPATEPKIRSVDRYISNGTVDATNGGWWENVPTDGVWNAAVFGAIPGNSGADNITAFQAWAARISASSFARGVIPPGVYAVDGGFGFTNSRFHISAHGVQLTQASSTAVTVDLNSGALADESVITSYITWEGGKIQHATAYSTTANTATGIRARGITRCTIANVEVEDMGVAFNPQVRDAMTLRDCHGFQNGVHIDIEDWQTPDNPQGLKFDGYCGWSIHYIAGLRINGNIAELTVDGFYATGSNAIVIENASSGSTSQSSVSIRSGGFEQGELETMTGSWTLSTGSATITAPGADGAATTEIAVGDRIETAGGNVYTVSSITDDDTIVLDSNPTANETTVTIYHAVPYIDIRDTNSGTMFNLTVDSCKFSPFQGATTLAHIMHCRSCDGVTFSNNYVSNRAPGWLWFDSSCSKISIANLVKAGTANYIQYDCDREDISVFPSVIDFPAYNGSNGNLIDSNAAKSTSDSATLDVSGQINAAYYPTDIHPKGYEFQMAARDSGSAASSTCYMYIVPSSSIAAGERFRYVNVELNGITNNVRQNADGYCPADDNGDVYIHYGATGTGTLDSYITLTRVWM